MSVHAPRWLSVRAACVTPSDVVRFDDKEIVVDRLHQRRHVVKLIGRTLPNYIPTTLVLERDQQIPIR